MNPHEGRPLDGADAKRSVDAFFANVRSDALDRRLGAAAGGAGEAMVRER